MFRGTLQLKRMKLFFICIMLMTMVACNNASVENEKNDTVIVVANNSVSLVRENPNQQAIASYSIDVADGVNNANNWKFAANIYETKSTFKFLLKMKYKELEESDTLVIPNLGFIPKVEIRKAATAQACIIGFYDKKNQFKEYKKLSVKNEQLKLTTINHYSVGVYQRKVN